MRVGHTFIEPAPGFTRPLRAGALALVSLLVMALAACGGGSSTAGQGTPVGGGAQPTSTVNCSSGPAANLHLVHSGQLTIGSDTTYAPAEFVDPNNPNHFIGYDMDLVREIARRMCLTPNIETANFDSIITNLTKPALGQQPWDMSISSFSINSDRLKVVDMIPYFIAGESTLVKKGNPSNIHTVTDMCGKNISVQNGTIELFELQDANGTGQGENDGGVTQAPVCKSNPIKLLTFNSEEDVINQVINGRADASYQDEPVTAYYVSLHAGQLEQGYLTQGSRGTEGIVVRKDNAALESAITNALNQMVQDGTYKRIMTAWGQQSLACLPNCPPAS